MLCSASAPLQRPGCHVHCLRAHAVAAAFRVLTAPRKIAGLDIEKNTIIEIACLVTDGDLKQVVEVGGLLQMHAPHRASSVDALQCCWSSSAAINVAQQHAALLCPRS